MWSAVRGNSTPVRFNRCNINCDCFSFIVCSTVARNTRFPRVNAIRECSAKQRPRPIFNTNLRLYCIYPPYRWRVFLATMKHTIKLKQSQFILQRLNRTRALLPCTALHMRIVHDHIVRTEYTRREVQNNARIGQKHSVSFNIFIIKGIRYNNTV